jgi:hypothetical protein
MHHTDRYQRKYETTSKRLFKVNSQVRDYDIICEKLQKYSSEPIYSKLIGSLNRKRKPKLASARKIALSLKDLPLPRVREMKYLQNNLRRDLIR